MNATVALAANKPRSLDELRATVSASRLNTWLSCRLKFYFRYVLGLTQPRTAALYVGHTVHGVLKVWHQAKLSHVLTALLTASAAGRNRWSGW